MTIEMSQFFQVFFDETEELLAEMEKLLLAIDVGSPDAEDLNAIFRAAHSIKGGASTFGLIELTEVTHVLESLLDKIRNAEMALTSKHVDAFLSAKDVLKMQLDGQRHGSPVDRNLVANIRISLEALLSEGTFQVTMKSQSTGDNGMHQDKGAALPITYRIQFPSLPENEVDALVAELGMLGEIERNEIDAGRMQLRLVTAQSAEEISSICTFLIDSNQLSIHAEVSGASTVKRPKTQKEIEEEQGYGFFDPLPEPVAAVSSATQGRVEEKSALSVFPEAESDVHQASRSTTSSLDASRSTAKRETDRSIPHHESSSIRVGIEKVDQLINLVGELVITQAMIEQRTGMLDPIGNERLLNSVAQLNRNTRDLQEAVMSIRMMPMDYVFSRFPRMVRDLATKMGKKIDFVTHGAATELDKGLIERIVDPLTHLIRNSIDHGIEMPEVRTTAGKSEAGLLSLSASHQGGNIVIEVTDDGGGLHREKIVQKASQRGLQLPENASDNDVWQLIFAPGFSTADQITDVSGRGVGMDVVKRNITAMGGLVDVKSIRGTGTTISISLPLTLAILDGMSVRVGNETYILPLNYVLESVQPRAQDIKQISGQGNVIRVRGEYLPVVELYDFFNITLDQYDPTLMVVVIVEADGRKAALLVDELLGQQQVVVKNLESNYRKVAGISGATILGDGGVSLIIDVAALLRSTREIDSEVVAL